MNEKINWAGLYVFNVYIKGAPYIIVVDDSFPVINYQPVFAGLGSDKSIWGMLLEKAFAKINGNYENLNAGYTFEGIEFLTNAPTK